MTTFSVNIHLTKKTIKVDFTQLEGCSSLSFRSTDDYSQVTIFMTMDQLKGVITDLQRFVTPPENDMPDDPEFYYNERAEQMP